MHYIILMLCCTFVEYNLKHTCVLYLYCNSPQWGGGQVNNKKTKNKIKKHKNLLKLDRQPIYVFLYGISIIHKTF